MEPIEINAGGHYLRGLRADERVDDSVAVASILGLSPEAARERIADLDLGWAEETELSWAVCEQTDPTCLAIVLYDAAAASAAAEGTARPGANGPALASASASALDITAAPGISDPEVRFAGPIAAIERFVATYRQGG